MKLMVKQLEEDIDLLADLVRVHSTYRPGIVAGEICRISADGKSILAVARNTRKNERGVIRLDDAMRKHLGVDEGEKVDFTITKANRWDNFMWAWRATNPVNRVAAQLGVISLALGLLSLIFPVWQLYQTILTGAK